MSQADYPKLVKLIKIVALDTNRTISGRWEWPTNAKDLEALASKLNPKSVDNVEKNDGCYYEEVYDNEFELFAAGEASDMKKLTQTKHLGPLHRFIEELFDGKLTKNFFAED